ncbi:MAG: prepilin-type N-terminal cleavage/methylation domain-containing protein [Chitinispirillaceae bacterium]
MLKNYIKGFSFIEVVVVVVIVTVLAAVAFPLYNGYVQDTRQDVVDNLAKNAAAAANAYWRKTGAAPTTEQLKLFYDENTYDIVIDGSNVTVTDKTRSSIIKIVPYTH